MHRTLQLALGYGVSILRRYVGGWLPLRPLLASEKASISIVFGFTFIPLIIAVGVGLDLWRAFAVKARLQASLDAAALAIASTDVTQFTQAQLLQRVRAFVTADYPAGVLGSAGPATLTFGLNASNNETINVTATATVETTFMRIAQINSLTIGAAAQVTLANPNIDFYLLLDSSPSMAIAATQADINTMVANTSAQGGCAFGCHQTSNPAADPDSLGNPKNQVASASVKAGGTGGTNGSATVTGTTGTGTPFQALVTIKGGKISAVNAITNPGNYTTNPTNLAKEPVTGGGLSGASLTLTMGVEDNYSLARNLGVTLRVDLLRQAAQNLMTKAQTIENTNLAVYRMAIYTFDIAFNTIQTVTANLATAQAAAGNINLLSVYSNNYLTNTNDNNDTDTNYDNAMTNINSVMPNPGNGSKVAGDTPQEVLFIVTDGVEDESVSGNRQVSVMDPGWCTTIKNRGIRIAVLYTTYLPLPTNSFYNSNVAPFQSNIGPTLQSCASPNLYFAVQTGGDISAALIALFQKAIATAYLSM
jgi:Flp pilus assembly protein TadG